jgi:putative ATP-dependent endonuclease of OLD family
MIIKSVEVKGFRSIREECLDCDNLTAIVGRNGAGKSSFLYALESFYDTAATIIEEDFFCRDMDCPIQIRVTYGDLRDDEKEEFSPYIRNDELIVTKRISSENGRIIQRYYAAALQIPQFAVIRAKPSKSERLSAWNALVDSGDLIDLGGRARSADAAERLMDEYEASHQELMKPIEREEQFFGPKNVGGGKLDKFTKYVLVPAVREASDEVTGRRGAIYQLLNMIVLRKINARKDIQEFKSEFEDRVKKLYSAENLTELPDLGASISKILKKFAPGSLLNLVWGEVKPPEVQPPAPKATLVEDDFEGEISRKGHGLQRALIVTLLQYLATIVPEESTTEESFKEEDLVSRSKGLETSQGPDLILAIEEPELYLHPSRCRYLADLLLQLSERRDIDLGASNQIIYTSHSPYFVDLHRFDQIRLVRKILSQDSPVRHSVVRRCSLSQAAEKLAKTCSASPTDFTRDSFKAHAMPVMNTIVNEGFFADVVVVVEGLSEVGTLWRLQEIMKKNWPELGIVVVPAGGSNNIDRPTVIFRGLSIPTYFIFDADSHLIGTGKEEDAKKRNHRYLSLAGVPVEGFPDTQVRETWAVFKENLEGLFKETLGNEAFRAIQNEVASELGYDDPERVSKNIDGVARLVELIYEKGHQIPILEEIIEKVTQLRNGEDTGERKDKADLA